MKHKDKCGHGKECYVGTMEYVSSPKSGLETFDVFIYESCGEQEVCIRYGSEDSEYISPGPLYSFLKSSANYEKYSRVAGLLLSKGKVKWERNT